MSIVIRGEKRILLVASHTMFRQVMARELSEEPGLCVSADVGTIADAENLVREQDVDLIITDVDLPDGSGVEFAASVKAQNPEIKVLVLGHIPCEETFMSAVRAGVDGYAIKDSSYEQLLGIINSVVAGQNAYDQQLCSSVVSRLLRSENEPTSLSPSEVELSPRECQVARLLSKGMTNKEIANALSISLSTTKTHVSKIFKRLGISSRRQLLPKIFYVAASDESGSSAGDN